MSSESEFARTFLTAHISDDLPEFRTAGVFGGLLIDTQELICELFHMLTEAVEYIAEVTGEPRGDALVSFLARLPPVDDEDDSAPAD